MYQPPHFREADIGIKHALIRTNPLGLLITAGGEGLTANAFPFALDAAASLLGTLNVHMARANGQWRAIEAGAEPLVVFQGIDGYVTPSWYATKEETGKVVPTWNYAMVQVRGRARVVDDPAWLRAQVGALTLEHETGRARPWAVEDAPEDYIAAQIRGIMGVEIEITDIAGKWKMSQNRPAADIARVGRALRDGSDPHGDPAMAELVLERGKAR